MPRHNNRAETGPKGRLFSREKALEIERVNRAARAIYLLFSVFTAFTISLYFMSALRDVIWLGSLNEHWKEVPLCIFIAYNSFLAIYISSKELTRYCLLKRSTRRGGRWVAIWWFSLVVIFSCWEFMPDIHIPRYLVPECLIVLGAFFGSEAFKKRFIRQMEGRVTKLSS
ncbi:hypothetical protein KKG41_06555 [Patescibacteria group bacterium]|nr:hypothetical protein [Patescibacteria group bacterium]MBU1890683.1 hypothetical protein [Patescibacteria group bacterium]